MRTTIFALYALLESINLMLQRLATHGWKALGALIGHLEDYLIRCSKLDRYVEQAYIGRLQLTIGRLAN